jgi:glycosyltransferase involved in cell wall biosynthesis
VSDGQKILVMKRKKNITWFAVARSPYNDFLFGQLSKTYNLSVFYWKNKLETHPWKFHDCNHRCKDTKEKFWENVKIGNESDLVIITGYDTIFHLMMLLLIKKNIRKVFWTDTINVRKRSSLSKFIRNALLAIYKAKISRFWATGNPGVNSLVELGIPIEKCRSFPFFMDNDGIDKSVLNTDVLSVKKHQDAANKIVFVSVGQLKSSKNHKIIIEAATKVSDKAQFWIIGDGPEMVKLREMAKDLKVENKVKFFGWLQQDTLQELLNSSDVFLHPAVTDPFPTVVLDAMARGKPILGTNTSGSVVDRVIHGNNGFIITPNNLSELVDHINIFLNNPKLCIQLGKNAKNTASNYDMHYALKIIEEAETIQK